MLSATEKKLLFCVGWLEGGKRTLTEQKVSLLRNSPEQEDGVYTVSLSGNRGPLEALYLHLNY